MNHMVSHGPLSDIAMNHMVSHGPLSGIAMNHMVSHGPLNGITMNHMFSHGSLNGIAMNYMISHGPLTSKTWVLTQGKSCVICGRQMGTATYVSSSTFNYNFCIFNSRFWERNKIPTSPSLTSQLTQTRSGGQLKAVLSD
jgi:hypothetical protein